MKKKSPYGMPPVESRQEFERNVFLVWENYRRMINSGDDDLAANAYWSTSSHLERVRFLPNGRIDLLTINEMLRNMGNMNNWMRFRDRPPKQREDDAGESTDMENE